MKLTKLIFALNVAVLLAACGSSTSGGSSTGSGSSTSGGSTTSGSTTSGSTSSGGSTSSSGGDSVAPTGLGYSMLPNGKDGYNYEPSEISKISRPNYDRDASIAAFEKTLYKHLRSVGCAGCHSSDSAGQAPLHSDSDVALAHDYALTRVNFADPENSRMVIRQKIERHGCARTNDSKACASAAEEMLSAVEDWADAVADMIPEAPRTVPVGETISEADVESWIAADKATLSSADKDYIIYTSLHEMHNDHDNVTAADLEIFRVGLSKALNSVARWAPEIKNPIDVNGKGILYKFDTRWYWGYNKGVTKIIFGGSDDDMAFGREGKMGVDGKQVPSNVQSQTYGYTKNITKDDNLAKLVWERILHGNVEGAKFNGNIPPYIDGFKGKTSSNAAGSYIKPADFEWVEAGQLVYTVTRPDVYNSIMMIPMHAHQLEAELGVEIKDENNGLSTWDLVTTWEAITIDSRLLFRAETDHGWYWKSWDIFTGQIEQGNISIYDVYNKYPDSIRFPWWANPLPKFVNTQTANGREDGTHSFIASLAQPYNSNPAGCDPQPSFSGIAAFKNCRHYSGTGGLQQAASEMIWDLPNGLQGYMLTGAFNQRRVDAFINIVRDPRIIRDATDEIGHFIDFEYTRSGGRKGNAGDPRLNVGSSCIGCHVDGMNRINNDSGDWARMEKEKRGSSPWPKGKYGIDAWIDDGKTLDKIIELYPPSETINEYNEEARKTFLGSMTEMKEGMMKGVDKNTYVEPVITVVEYVQSTYNYPQTTSN